MGLFEFIMVLVSIIIGLGLAEILAGVAHALLRRQITLDAWQHEFDQWRHVYNHERPHEAIDLKPPGTVYRPSSRPFPEVLPPVTYHAGEIIRKVASTGRINFKNRVFRIGKAFRGQPVAIRPTDTDGVFDVYFCKQKVAQISFLEDNC